jgi:hypothetical protein
MKTAVITCVVFLILTASAVAQTQTSRPPHRDRLWDGMLIGAAIGTVVGMVLAPPAFCGRNDSECAAIVRVAIGLPAIGAGIGIGALVDGLHKSQATNRPFTGARGALVRIRF